MLWLPGIYRLPASFLSQVDPISRLVYVKRVFQTDAYLTCANISVTPSILVSIGEITNLVGNVYPRFIRERVACEDNVVTTPSKVWALVHLQPNAVTEPMGEVLLPAVGLQHRSGGLVGDPR